MRFADDFVVVFKDRQDGERVLDVEGKRLARYGFRLHLTKTRFVDIRPGRGGDHGVYDQFDFLSFTHLRGRLRKGRWVARRFTGRTRLARATKSVWEWCKENRHQLLGAQHRHLTSVIRGHCTYYGLTGNGKQPARFREAVIRSWRCWFGWRHRTGKTVCGGQRHPEHLPPLQAKVTRTTYAPSETDM